MEIVGGVHLGKRAKFLKRTPKRVYVHVEGVGPRYLSPKSLP